MNLKSNTLDILSQINVLSPSISIGGNDDILNHKFYFAHADRFSSQQTVKLPPQTLEMKSVANGNYWKQLLPFSVKDGTIYSDELIEVTCLIQVMKFLERIQITFVPKTSGVISDV